MRILLLYAGNSLNYGAFMMTANLISHVNRRISSSHFLVGANSESDIRRMKLETANAPVAPFETNKVTPADWRNRPLAYLKDKLFGHNNSILRHNPDCIIALGGDDLSEYYEEWRILFDLINIRILAKRSKVILVGQTIGPFYSFRRRLAHHCLKHILIYTRDPNNTAYLQNELALTNVIESSDLAFLDLPLENSDSYSLDKYDLKENEYITLVPSGLVDKYTSDLDAYLCEWIKVGCPKRPKITPILFPVSGPREILLSQAWQRFSRKLRGLKTGKNFRANLDAPG